MSKIARYFLYPLLLLPTLSIAETAKDKGEQGEPGSFKIDEESSVRALERSLIQSGSLLLPPGKLDFETGLSFSHSESEVLLFIDANGNTTVGQTKQKRNRIDVPFRFRIGMPYDSQIDFSIPFNYVEQSSIASAGNNTLLDVDEHGSGFGDARVSLSKTLFREKGALPDLIGRFTWDADNGKQTDNNISLGGAGFNEYRLGITATKRQDPLVFSGTISAQTTSKKDDIEAGDEYSISLGTFLAASPSTSLQFSLDQSFVKDSKVNGATVVGSDQTISLLNIGASTVFSPKSFMSLSAGVGLTDDSPDYIVNLFWTTRFDLPD